ncbi:MAG: hypothetical protein QNK03_16155 [Myxococcota bacterium]|nr:hypothetical protein [Myxococcota bacterium]
MAQAPAWLFSFVDLAFLLLIAMTQISGDGQGVAPVFGEIVVPRVEGGAETELPTTASERWQIRVHPAAGGDAGPFELVRPADPTADLERERLASDELGARLDALATASAQRPLLSPHADSRSEDMLEAVALLERHWPGRRRSTIVPRLGQP